MPKTLTIRTVEPSDHANIITVLVDWWDGRDMRAMVPRLFLDHFCNTSFVTREGERLLAFLVGFLSPTRRREGYIHFVGVHPDFRGQGLGTGLYHGFF